MADPSTKIVRELEQAAIRLQTIKKTENWKEDSAKTTELLQILTSLTPVKVSKELLMKTGIGKIVKSVSKHSDPRVKGYSSSLVKKWMEQIGLMQPSKSTENGHIPAKSPTSRLEEARQKLRNNYANNKAQKDSRTLRVLNSAPGAASRRKKGTVVKVDTSPTKSVNRRPRSATLGMMRSTKTMPRSATVVRSSKNMSLAERHARRQQLLRQRAQVSSISKASNGSTGARTAAGAKSASSAAPQTERQAMLAKKFPRIRGVNADDLASAKSSGKKKNVSAGEKEVRTWFKGLLVDMSQYADAFVAQGFDSMAILKTMKKSDIEELVSKKAHRRIVEEAIADLGGGKRREERSEKRYKSESRRSRPRSVPRYSEADEFDSCDDFIASDDDIEGGYRPGVISQMMRGKRRRAYDSDSSDMEASFDEIRAEESRSRQYGQMEDDEEERREKERSRKRRK